MSDELARLRWRCRRGLRELDTLLKAFLDESFDSLGDDDKRRFAAILELPDPDLYGYIVRRNEPEDPDAARLIARIRRSLHPRA